MKAEALAEAISYELDGEYHDGLEVDIAAHVEDGASLVVTVIPDRAADQRFRVVVVEIVEEAA